MDVVKLFASLVILQSVYITEANDANTFWVAYLVTGEHPFIPGCTASLLSRSPTESGQSSDLLVTIAGCVMYLESENSLAKMEPRDISVEFVEFAGNGTRISSFRSAVVELLYQSGMPFSFWLFSSRKRIPWCQTHVAILKMNQTVSSRKGLDILTLPETTSHPTSGCSIDAWKREYQVPYDTSMYAVPFTIKLQSRHDWGLNFGGERVIRKYQGNETELPQDPKYVYLWIAHGTPVKCERISREGFNLIAFVRHSISSVKANLWFAEGISNIDFNDWIKEVLKKKKI